MEEGQNTQLTTDDFNQNRFLQEYIKSGNATQAYKVLHPTCTDESAATGGWRMLRNVELSQLMEAMGITDDALLKHIAVGIIKPTKMEVIEDYGKDGKKLREVVDYNTRARFIELALKLKGKLKNEAPAQNNQLNFGEGAKIEIINYADKQAVQVTGDAVTVVGQKENI